MREIATALPWVHEASQPYLDWLVGGRSAALRILESWMRRPSSEVFIGRAVIAEETHPVGGFIALPGAELAVCRMKDALAAAAAAPGPRSSLLRRLRLGRALFMDVAADDLYLSRMGVLAEERRRGYGEAIVREHLERGRRQGFRRFTLDVWAGNTAAIQLYRSVGFQAEPPHHVEDVGMTYVRMALETSPPLERARGERDSRAASGAA